MSGFDRGRDAKNDMSENGEYFRRLDRRWNGYVRRVIRNLMPSFARTVR